MPKRRTLSSDGTPVGRLPWLWIGLAAVFLVGLAYGIGLNHWIATPYFECGQGSPGMAALGYAVIGLVPVPFVFLPLIAVTYRLMVMRALGGWVVGCMAIVSMVGLAIAGIVAGSLLHGWLWTVPDRSAIC